MCCTDVCGDSRAPACKNNTRVLLLHDVKTFPDTITYDDGLNRRQLRNDARLAKFSASSSRHRLLLRKA